MQRKSYTFATREYGEGRGDPPAPAPSKREANRDPYMECAQSSAEAILLLLLAGLIVFILPLVFVLSHHHHH